MSTAATLLLLNGVGAQPFPWPPSARAPFTLPPGPYNQSLLYTPPPLPDRRYVRMDAWGVTIPGLPFVPEGSSEHPERCLTGFYNRWDANWRAAIRAAHRARGYTHVLFWLPDALYGPMGVSIDAYVNLCREWRDDGFWCCHWLGSKVHPEFIAHDQSASVWATALDPILDKLAGADCLHHAILGGEFDLWNIPGQTTCEIAQWAVSACQPHGADVYFHFSTWKTWWGTDDRFSWTSRMCDLGVRGLYFQGDSAADLPTYQGRIADSLGRIDARFDIVNGEVVASEEFTQDHPNEFDACVKGYGCQCVVPASPVPGVQLWGYGNGAYRPDGSGL